MAEVNVKSKGIDNKEESKLHSQARWSVSMLPFPKKHLQHCRPTQVGRHLTVDQAELPVLSLQAAQLLNWVCSYPGVL